MTKRVGNWVLVTAYDHTTNPIEEKPRWVNLDDVREMPPRPPSAQFPGKTVLYFISGASHFDVLESAEEILGIGEG